MFCYKWNRNTVQFSHKDSYVYFFKFCVIIWKYFVYIWLRYYPESTFNLLEKNVNKRKFLRKDKVQLQRDWLGTTTWTLFVVVLEHQYGGRGVMQKRW